MEPSSSSLPVWPDISDPSKLEAFSWASAVWSFKLKLHIVSKNISDDDSKMYRGHRSRNIYGSAKLGLILIYKFKGYSQRGEVRIWYLLFHEFTFDYLMLSNYFGGDC